MTRSLTNMRFLHQLKDNRTAQMKPFASRGRDCSLTSYKYPEESLWSLQNTNKQSPETLVFKENKDIQTDDSGHLTQGTVMKLSKTHQ